MNVALSKTFFPCCVWAWPLFDSNMKSICFLIIGYSNDIPDNITDHEMIMLSEGFDDQENEKNIVPVDNCSYMTTFAHKELGKNKFYNLSRLLIHVSADASLCVCVAPKATYINPSI